MRKVKVNGNTNMKMKVISLVSVLLLILGIGLTGCGSKDGNGNGSAASNVEKPTLILADPGWDSVHFHNSVVQFIIENGYGYKTDVLNGSTPITFAALAKGNIDIYTEIWTDNIGAKYAEEIQNGNVIELSMCYDDNAQGLYVPTYLIEGDSSKGIAPLAPNLKKVTDLPEYWELFKDQEDPSKGRLYGATPGWEADSILRAKFESYKLNETYNYFSPGSGTALDTSLTQAVEKGAPWVGYYWEPTWIMGKYDMTLLEDAPYDEALWNDGRRCAFKPCPVTVGVHKDMEQKAPEVVGFLKNYQSSNALTNEALAYMLDNNATADQTAKWFLETRADLWTPWVPSEIAAKVNAALK